MFRALTVRFLWPCGLLLYFVVASGCDSQSADTAGMPCCDSTAAPIYLQSKLDDDDGDGNPYDEDFPRIDDEDDDIADHAWIRDRHGTYHLFFQNEDRGSGSHIEHYTSVDLRSLDYVGTALSANPAGWDSYSLWAPHIVENDGTYYMLYTGTDGPGDDPDTQQRLGVATSKDLITWTRISANNCPGTSGDGCVYECDEGWTTWGGEKGSNNQQCRDPFVMWDADNGRWVLFATAKSTNQFAVVTVAHSADLVSWAGVGFIDATRRLENGVGAQTTGGQAENPFVMSHDGTRYLLFTDWRDPEDSVSVHDPRTIVQYATSPTLDADTMGSVNWMYRGYTPDPAVNAIEVQQIDSNLWIMSQSLSNQRSGLWKRRRQLRLKCVVWGANYTFDTVNASLQCGNTSRPGGLLGVEAASNRR